MTLTILIVGVWLGFAASVRQKVAFPLQTLSNLLAAMREGDFSIRGRGATSPDALGEVIREVNALGQTLREQRLGAVEATTLLRKVVEEIDVAMFTFDGTQHLRGREPRRGTIARPFRRNECWAAPPPNWVWRSVWKASQRAPLKSASPAARDAGECAAAHFARAACSTILLVLSDLSRALREEERQAWQRLDPRARP